MTAGTRETIAAIATPAGRGGIGVIRISGEGVTEIARAILGAIPRPRVATLAHFMDSTGMLLDVGVALYFPAPGSYTGEDVLELQGHGGPVVLGSVLGACLDAGARIAEPGEFSRRAFLAGKMDLTQAEAVADLIDAGTRQAARAALRSMSGEFSREVNELQSVLSEARALIEAAIDFPEEVGGGWIGKEAQVKLVEVRGRIDGVLQSCRRGAILREGLHVVIAGRPNVGKSSLMNRLVGDERSIVASTPGTTRDVLREVVEVRGIRVTLADTAGIRMVEEEVERIGIARARTEIGRADLVLLVCDARRGWTEEDTALAAEFGTERKVIKVYNKADLVEGASRDEARDDAGGIWVSARTGAGIARLREVLASAVASGESGETPFLARERHIKALEEVGSRVAGAIAVGESPEICAEELRGAQEALSLLTGARSADDLLGEIFGKFCIGK